MLQLLACNSKQKIQSDWMSCCTALNACLENINVIREIFQTLKVRVSLANVPSIVNTSSVVSSSAIPNRSMITFTMLVVNLKKKLYRTIPRSYIHLAMRIPFFLIFIRCV
jgi:hypothetical protein